MNKTTLRILALASIALATSCSSPKSTDGPAAAAPTPAWAVTQGLENPESAYYDATTGLLFVSNVAGNPGEKDKKGWISKLDATGRVLKAQWVSGLNAPKGMRSEGGTLWVSDIDEIVSIDIRTGKIKQRVKAPGAKFLNDVAIGPKGEVYVSDTFGGRIYVVRGDKARVFAESTDLESPNGLLLSGTELVVAAWGKDPKPDFSTEVPGRLLAIDLGTKKIRSISSAPVGNLDGLEAGPSGGFLVTDWIAGKVFAVSREGGAELLLEGFKGAADIGWIPRTHTLVVPRMMENAVSAYTLR